MSTGWPQSQQDLRRPYADDREDRHHGGVALDHPSGPLPVSRPDGAFGPNHPSGPLPIGEPRRRGLRRGRDADRTDDPLNDADYDWIRYLGEAGSAQEPFGGRDEARGSRRSMPGATPMAGAPDLPVRRQARGGPSAAASRAPGRAIHSHDARRTHGDSWPGDRSGWPDDSGWPSADRRPDGWPTAPQRGGAEGPRTTALHRPEPQPGLARSARHTGPTVDRGQGRGVARALSPAPEGSRSATLTQPRPLAEPRPWTEPGAPGSAPGPDAQAAPATKPSLGRPGRHDRRLAALKQNRGLEPARALADTQPRGVRPRTASGGATTLTREAPRTPLSTRSSGPAAVVAPRPAPAALTTAPRPTAAPADRPRKAQAKAAAVKAASLKTASPRLAGVKTAAPRPARQRAAGATPGRHRIVRRSVLLVGGASAAAAAAVFAADFAAAGPTHSISTPQRLMGYVQEPAMAVPTGANQLRNEIVTKAGSEATNVVDAVYMENTAAGPQILTFVGGNMSGSASSFISGLTAALPGSFTTSAGSMQGEAACVSAVAGRHLAECAWADNDTFGVIESPSLTAAQLGADLRAMRPLIERVVK